MQSSLACHSSSISFQYFPSTVNCSAVNSYNLQLSNGSYEMYIKKRVEIQKMTNKICTVNSKISYFDFQENHWNKNGLQIHSSPKLRLPLGFCTSTESFNDLHLRNLCLNKTGKYLSKMFTSLPVRETGIRSIPISRACERENITCGRENLKDFSNSTKNSAKKSEFKAFVEKDMAYPLINSSPSTILPPRIERRSLLLASLALISGSLFNSGRAVADESAVDVEPPAAMVEEVEEGEKAEKVEEVEKFENKVVEADIVPSDDISDLVAQEEPNEELEVFGFDGLGHQGEDYAATRVVALAQSGEGAVLFLGVEGYELPMRMVVGAAEAMAVLTAAQERKSRRPVTHEAWGLTLEAVGWRVTRVAITSIDEDVYYCRVILGDTSPSMSPVSPSVSVLRSVDVRPSDGIALALRCKAPLFVSREVAESVLLKGQKKKSKGGELKVDPLDRPGLQARVSGGMEEVFVQRYINGVEENGRNGPSFVSIPSQMA